MVVFPSVGFRFFCPPFYVTFSLMDHGWYPFICNLQSAFEYNYSSCNINTLVPWNINNLVIKFSKSWVSPSLLLQLYFVPRGGCGGEKNRIGAKYRRVKLLSQVCSPACCTCSSVSRVKPDSDNYWASVTFCINELCVSACASRSTSRGVHNSGYLRQTEQRNLKWQKKKKMLTSHQKENSTR